MARIEQLPKKDRQSSSRHKIAEASYSSFEIDGEKFLQIDTYGTADREMPGKISQSLQFDKEAAMALMKLIKSEFSL